MFENIPVELRQHHAWVVWRYATLDNDKITKRPHNARTGHRASVTNPDDWSTYDEAVAAASGYDGIGFVLSDNDPYTVIDLDKTDDLDALALHREIAIEFADSYQEVSPSGEGLHIWVRGNVEAGRRRNGVEIYPGERYMTVTGNRWGSAELITDQQEKLDSLYQHIGEDKNKRPVFANVGNEPERNTDREVYDMAVAAKNGTKFYDLHNGEWEKYYAPPRWSQSEGDFALINILGFYSGNREQIARIFRASALGQRDKAQRDNYVQPMVTRAFDRKVPRANIEALKAKLDFELELKKNPSAGEPLGDDERNPSNELASPTGTPQTDINPYAQSVPGLTGKIADFIYENAPRPVREIAVAGALGLMAGITGRGWNISNTGLNQYFLLLANTGSGKEAMASGIGALMAALTEPTQNGIAPMPSARQFVGPSRIASGQAIVRYITNKSKSFVSIFGEFDTLLKTLTDPRASEATRNLRQFILDIYAKSGRNDTLEGTVYADKDKDLKSVGAPSFSVLAECTPSRLYGLLDTGMIDDGLLPRMNIIEYKGKRMHSREDPGAKPSPELIKELTDLCAYASMLNQQNIANKVEQEPDARAMLLKFDRDITDRMNGPDANSLTRELGNRVHLRALKLAAMLAVGVNPTQPIITMVEALWAVNAINYSTNLLAAKFKSGEVGDIETMQFTAMRKAFMWATTAQRDLINTQMWNDRVVPLSALMRYIGRNKAFTDDNRVKPSLAVKHCIASLIEQGVIAEISPQDRSKYDSRARLFVVSDASWLVA